MTHPLQSQDVSRLAKVPSADHALTNSGDGPSPLQLSRPYTMAVEGYSQSDGDTQPLSPRVYQEFAGRSKTPFQHKQFAGSNETNCETNESTERTYLPGQIGHVDLIQVLEQVPKPSHEMPSQDQGDEEDPLSQGADVRAEIYPESNRFQAPKTPATNRGFQNRTSESLEHVHSTPHLPLNPFAGRITNLDVMDASQAFKATQAVSSPVVHVIHSDGLLERPSPDMYNMQRPATAASLSSPTRMATLSSTRTTMEPHTTYISMQESQAERENRLRQAALRQQSSTSVSSGDDFDSDDSQLRRRRLQRSIDLKARDQFLGVTAPSRSSPSRQGRGRGRGNHRQHHQTEITNTRLGKKASEAVIISDELSAEENVTEDETDQEVDSPQPIAGEIDELADDNKENVEVPRTAVKQYRRKAAGRVPQSSPSRAVQGNNSDLHSQGPTTGPEMVNQNHGVNAKLPIDSGTQTSTVADSQLSPNQRKQRPPSKTVFNGVDYSVDPRIDIPQSPPVDVINHSLTANAIDSTTGGFNPASSKVQIMHRADNDNSPLSVKSRPAVDIIRKGDLPTEMDSVPSSAPRTTDPKTTTEMVGNVKIPPLSNSGDEIQPWKNITPEELPHLYTTVEASAEKDEPEPRTAIPGSSLNASILPSEIPETSSTIRRPINPHDTLSSVKPSTSVLPRSLLDSSLAGSTPFETAQTNLISSARKSHLHRSPPKSWQKPSSSGQSSLPAKTFGQIAADPSPLDPVGDIDLDINLLSNEDLEFQNVMNGSSPAKPAKKRRNGITSRILDIEELKQDPRPEPGPEPGVGPRPVLSTKPESELHPESDQNSHSHSPNRKSRKTIEQDFSAVDELADDNLPMTARTIAQKVRPPDQKTSRNYHLDEIKTKSPRGRPRKVQPLDGISGGRGPDNSKAKDKDAGPGSGKPLSAINDRSNFPKVLNGTANHNDILAPNRVLAYFNGTCAAFYPATCIGVDSGNESKLKVCFDDGTIDTVSRFNVKRLELRIGDLVRVDTTGLRNTTYVVQGLSNPCNPSAIQPPLPQSTVGQMSSTGTDVYGNATILATVKKRQSGNAHELEGKTFSIPITDIYLTQGMWTNFKDRQYNFASVISPPFSRLQTPSETTSVSSSSTSRDRRPKVSGIANPRSSLTASMLGRGLFKNMVFAVTNILRQVDRDRTTRLILSNGGVMLADGFNELFDIPELELVSASKASPKKPIRSSFGLNQAGQRIGFACLIADKHCRKAKYIQALALGIPCLATRWVQDCVSARCVLPWESYLLSSGESSFLGGATRSRMLPAYSPTDIALPSIVGNRPKLLAGESVLLVMSKAEEETMKNHPLFTHALGASRVSRVTSLEAAAKVVTKAYVDGEPWDWLYSHDNEKLAEKVIFGSNSGGRKRKRVWDSEVEREGGVSAKRKTKVVGNEFVIQSLILGRLVDLN